MLPFYIIFQTNVSLSRTTLAFVTAGAREKLFDMKTETQRSIAVVRTEAH
jgi:hypothetical protein